MPRINIGTLNLNYADSGHGETILFIPGLVGLHEAWEFQISHFSKRYRCVTFDHRGAGESDKPLGDESYSTENIALDAIGLLDALKIDKAHVIGTSTGGCVAQNLAIDSPGRLGACIFTNTWTKADIFFRRLQTYRKWIAESHGQEAYVEFSSVLTNGAKSFRENLDKVMALEARAKQTVSPVEIISARINMTLNHNRTGELHKIESPSLVLGTTDDSTVPVYFSFDLHQAIKGSQLHLLEEGGHYSYRSHADEWNVIVEKFLDEAAV